MPLREIFDRLNQKSKKVDSYFEVYDQLFERFKGKKNLTLVEIGVLNGGSLVMWRELFGADARIIGVDASPTAEAMREHGFEIYIGDQGCETFWRDFFTKVGPVDILIDDGGHTNKHQITTVKSALGHIENGGLLIVEDIGTSYLPQYGNPSTYSFMNYCKWIIDKLQARSSLVAGQENSFSEAVFSVTFYKSMVCFHIDRRLCRASEIVEIGTTEIGALNYWNADKRLVGFEAGRRGRAILEKMPLVGRLAIAAYSAVNNAASRGRFKAENFALRRYFK